MDGSVSLRRRLPFASLLLAAVVVVACVPALVRGQTYTVTSSGVWTPLTVTATFVPSVPPTPGCTGCTVILNDGVSLNVSEVNWDIQHWQLGHATGANVALTFWTPYTLNGNPSVQMPLLVSSAPHATHATNNVTLQIPRTYGSGTDCTDGGFLCVNFTNPLVGTVWLAGSFQVQAAITHPSGAGATFVQLNPLLPPYPPPSPTTHPLDMWCVVLTASNNVTLIGSNSLAFNNAEDCLSTGGLVALPASVVVTPPPAPVWLAILPFIDSVQLTGAPDPIHTCVGGSEGDTSKWENDGAINIAPGTCFQGTLTVTSGTTTVYGGGSVPGTPNTFINLVDGTNAGAAVLTRGDTSANTGHGPGGYDIYVSGMSFVRVAGSTRVLSMGQAVMLAPPPSNINQDVLLEPFSVVTLMAPYVVDPEDFESTILAVPYAVPPAVMPPGPYTATLQTDDVINGVLQVPSQGTLIWGGTPGQTSLVVRCGGASVVFGASLQLAQGAVIATPFHVTLPLTTSKLQVGSGGIFDGTKLSVSGLGSVQFGSGSQLNGPLNATQLAVAIILAPESGVLVIGGSGVCALPTLSWSGTLAVTNGATLQINNAQAFGLGANIVSAGGTVNILSGLIVGGLTGTAPFVASVSATLAAGQSFEISPTRGLVLNGSLVLQSASNVYVQGGATLGTGFTASGDGFLNLLSCTLLGPSLSAFSGLTNPIVGPSDGGVLTLTGGPVFLPAITSTGAIVGTDELTTLRIGTLLIPLATVMTNPPYAKSTFSMSLNAIPLLIDFAPVLSGTIANTNKHSANSAQSAIIIARGTIPPTQNLTLVGNAQGALGTNFNGSLDISGALMLDGCNVLFDSGYDVLRIDRSASANPSITVGGKALWQLFLDLQMPEGFYSYPAVTIGPPVAPTDGGGTGSQWTLKALNANANAHASAKADATPTACNVTVVSLTMTTSSSVLQLSGDTAARVRLWVGDMTNANNGAYGYVSSYDGHLVGGNELHTPMLFVHEYKSTGPNDPMYSNSATLSLNNGVGGSSDDVAPYTLHMYVRAYTVRFNSGSAPTVRPLLSLGGGVICHAAPVTTWPDPVSDTVAPPSFSGGGGTIVLNGATVAANAYFPLVNGFGPTILGPSRGVTTTFHSPVSIQQGLSQWGGTVQLVGTGDGGTVTWGTNGYVTTVAGAAMATLVVAPGSTVQMNGTIDGATSGAVGVALNGTGFVVAAGQTMLFNGLNLTQLNASSSAAGSTPSSVRADGTLAISNGMLAPEFVVTGSGTLQLLGGGVVLSPNTAGLQVASVAGPPGGTGSGTATFMNADVNARNALQSSIVVNVLDTSYQSTFQVMGGVTVTVTQLWLGTHIAFALTQPEPAMTWLVYAPATLVLVNGELGITSVMMQDPPPRWPVAADTTPPALSIGGSSGGGGTITLTDSSDWEGSLFINGAGSDAGLLARRITALRVTCSGRAPQVLVSGFVQVAGAGVRLYDVAGAANGTRAATTVLSLYNGVVLMATVPYDAFATLNSVQVTRGTVTITQLPSDWNARVYIPVLALLTATAPSGDATVLSVVGTAFNVSQLQVYAATTLVFGVTNPNQTVSVAVTGSAAVFGAVQYTAATTYNQWASATFGATSSLSFINGLYNALTLTGGGFNTLPSGMSVSGAPDLYVTDASAVTLGTNYGLGLSFGQVTLGQGARVWFDNPGSLNIGALVLQDGCTFSGAVGQPNTNQLVTLAVMTDVRISSFAIVSGMPRYAPNVTLNALVVQAPSAVAIVELWRDGDFYLRFANSAGLMVAGVDVSRTPDATHLTLHIETLSDTQERLTLIGAYGFQVDEPPVSIRVKGCVNGPAVPPLPDWVSITPTSACLSTDMFAACLSANNDTCNGAHFAHICVAAQDGITCPCNPGWEGAACSIAVDTCASGPCYPGVQCINTVGEQYKCLCPAGFNVTTATDPRQCVPCPAGTFSSSLGVLCAACPNATYAQEGSAQCVPCPAGFKSSGTQAGACTPCSVGSYQPNAGAMSCIPCGPVPFDPDTEQPVASSMDEYCPAASSARWDVSGGLHSVVDAYTSYYDPLSANLADQATRVSAFHNTLAIASVCAILGTALMCAFVIRCCTGEHNASCCTKIDALHPLRAADQNVTGGVVTLCALLAGISLVIYASYDYSAVYTTTSRFSAQANVGQLPPSAFMAVRVTLWGLPPQGCSPANLTLTATTRAAAALCDGPGGNGAPYGPDSVWTPLGDNIGCSVSWKCQRPNLQSTDTISLLVRAVGPDVFARAVEVSVSTPHYSAYTSYQLNTRPLPLNASLNEVLTGTGDADDGYNAALTVAIAVTRTLHLLNADQSATDNPLGYATQLSSAVVSPGALVSITNRTTNTPLTVAVDLTPVTGANVVSETPILSPIGLLAQILALLSGALTAFAALLRVWDYARDAQQRHNAGGKSESALEKISEAACCCCLLYGHAAPLPSGNASGQAVDGRDGLAQMGGSDDGDEEVPLTMSGANPSSSVAAAATGASAGRAATRRVGDFTAFTPLLSAAVTPAIAAPSRGS